jgi:hypothetical protein
VRGTVALISWQAELKPAGLAISVDMAAWFTNNVDEFFKDNQDALQAILEGNACSLLSTLDFAQTSKSPRLTQGTFS